MEEFFVDDMTCGHCASLIAKAVSEVDRAAKCEIDLAAKKVRVLSDQPAGDFQVAIEDAGYTAVPV